MITEIAGVVASTIDQGGFSTAQELSTPIRYIPGDETTPPS